METQKGRQLWLTAQQECLTILMDPGIPTCIGNSVARKTSPDLTFVKNCSSCAWGNRQECLGGDHYFLEISIGLCSQCRKNKGLHIAKWDCLREIQQQTAPKTAVDLDAWTTKLQSDVQAYTSEINYEDSDPITEVDTRLLHMWQVRKSTQHRWVPQGKRNHKLQLCIAKIDHEIGQHAAKLTTQKRHQASERMQCSLGMAKTLHCQGTFWTQTRPRPSTVVK